MKLRNNSLLLLLSILFINLSIKSFAQEAEAKMPTQTKKSQLNQLGTNNGQDIETDEFSWQISLGFGLGVHQTVFAGDYEAGSCARCIRIPLLVDAYYKGFFLQSSKKRSEGVFGQDEFGYQISTQKNWSLDILSKTYLDELDSEEIIEENELENSLLEGLSKRREGQGLAIRYSRFFDEDILYVDIASLYTTDAANDYVVDLYYSHFIPYYNWDIYIGGGLTYFSESTTNYYFGIDESEVTEQREHYQVSKGAFSAQLEAIALYPMTENWTFNIGVHQTYYSNEIADSPITERKNTLIASFGVLYAF